MNAPINPKPATGISATVADTLFSKNCDKCSASFRWPGNLKNHKKESHDGRRYMCRRCPKFYINKHQLTKHIKTAHTQRTVQEPATDRNQWVLDIMKDAGHPICPITNAQLLQNMKEDVVVLLRHPRLSASLQSEFDKMPEDQQLLGFTKKMNNKIEKRRRMAQIVKATKSKTAK